MEISETIACKVKKQIGQGSWIKAYEMCENHPMLANIDFEKDSSAALFNFIDGSILKVCKECIEEIDNDDA